jgi:serine/threonine-protein kinase
MAQSPRGPISDDERTRSASSLIGSWVVGKWQLEHLLGVGGMASVFAARHRNGNRVAVKMLHPELRDDAEIRDRFLEERYSANEVNHPGVVAVEDDGETEDGTLFLVMDLMDGETLEQRRMRGVLPPYSVNMSSLAISLTFLGELGWVVHAYIPRFRLRNDTCRIRLTARAGY